MLQGPPILTGERRAISEHCDVIVNDVEDGVTVVVDLRGKHTLQLRFDFSSSENLVMRPSDDVEQTGAMTSRIVLPPGTAKTVCWLQVDDPINNPSFGVSYRVDCFVQNDKGLFVPLASPSNSGVPAVMPDKRSAVCSTLDIIVKSSGGGYTVCFENTGSLVQAVTCDFSGSENLVLETIGGGATLGPRSELLSVIAQIPPNSGVVAVANMTIKDKIIGASNLNYRISAQEVSAISSREAEAERENARREREQQLERQQELAREAEELRRRKAQEEAAIVAAAAERERELQLERERAQEAERRRQAEIAENARLAAEAALAERLREEEEAARERATAAAEEARRKAVEDRLRQEQEEAERVRQEAERVRQAAADAQRKKQLAAELLRVKEELTTTQEEERLSRIKVEAEWKVRFGVFIKNWELSVCSLCRQVLPARGYQTAGTMRIHVECYEKAPKCAHCDDIIVGEYLVCKGDAQLKLHKACVDAFKEKSRPYCVACQTQILDRSWYTANGLTYHARCRPAAESSVVDSA